MADETVSGASPSGLRGEVVYLYAFDVANEVRLGAVAKLLSEPPVPFTIRPDRSAPRSIPLSHPLAIEPSPPSVQLFGLPIRLLVRVYEVGVVSVIVRAAFAVDSLSELLPFHNPVLGNGRPLDGLARDLCDEVCRSLEGCLVRSGPMSEPEAYTAFTLTHMGGERDANQWLSGCRRQVAGLLTETPADHLSEAQVDEVLRLRRSFENTDLVVIDWDAALVVDLNAYAEDVLFVLELANLQLEEFRWMDRALDGYLDRAYADLVRPRSRFGTASSVLHSLRRLRIDLARLADEVTHTTKFVGDWHLARVYVLARERFHIEQWRASVANRLSHLDDLYNLVRGELHDYRMLWLEVVIVIFFATDLLILLFKP